MPLAANAHRAFRVFASPTAVSRSWYPACRSLTLRPGRVRAFDLLDRRIAIYRDAQGEAHALDARCPHLGADLTLGSVEGSALRCAFHGWCFAADGLCVDAPGRQGPSPRRARAYPVDERWGFVWIFNGPAPLFPLPTPGPGAGRIRALRLPAQRIACHPHLVLANGLDLVHYERLHGMRFSEPPALQVGGHTVTVTLRGRPISRLRRTISGAASTEIAASFTTIGGSLAWVTITKPVHFDVLFTGRPDRAGGCITQTVFLFPSRPGSQWLRGLALMAMLLHDDRRLLGTLDFRPQFDDADAPLRAYAEVVDSLGAW